MALSYFDSIIKIQCGRNSFLEEGGYGTAVGFSPLKLRE
jgi:hypothetical protein